MGRADLLHYGTRLGQRDVLHNLSDLNTCEECGKYFQNRQLLKACDGSFPICAGQSFPLDGLGSHLHCMRGRVCNPKGGGGCFDLDKGVRAPWKKILKPRTHSQYFYLCSCCAKGSQNYLDFWGENVVAPGIDSSPNALAPTNVPFIPAEGHLSPHLAFDLREAKRAEQFELVVSKVAAKGGAIAVLSAADFYRFVRSICLSKNGQRALLLFMHKLHEARKKDYYASFGADAYTYGDSTLHTKVKSMEDTAAPAVILDRDIEFYKVRLSIHNLKFRESSVEIFTAHAGRIIQEMLLDPRFDHKKFFLAKKGKTRVYTHEVTGELYYGPEPMHGSRWKDVESTIPFGSCLMFLVLSMDETKGKGGKQQFPYQMKLGNFDASDCRKRYGTQVFATGAIIPTNKTRGTHESAGGNNVQTAARNAVSSTGSAFCLLPLNMLAKTEQTFYYPDRRSTITVSIRCGSMPADYEETKCEGQIYGGNDCARCRGLHFARALEARDRGESKSEHRHYMRPGKEFTCAHAEPRTVEYVVQKQAEHMEELRFGTKSKANDLVQETGANSHCENMLHRLNYLFPHETHSVYGATGPDFLHVVLLGIEMKFTVEIDAALKAFHRKDLTNFRSLADSRDRQDVRLAMIPPFIDLQTFYCECMFNVFRSCIRSISVILTFIDGWWLGLSAAHVPADHQDSLFSTLLYTYLDDKDQFPDEPPFFVGFGDRLARLHFDLCMLIREVQFPQWYTETEHAALQADFDHVIVEMNWLQQVLINVGYLTGEGFNIIKFHDFAAIPGLIKVFGSICNLSTDAFEMRMRDIKTHDEHTASSRLNSGHEAVFKRAVAQDLDDRFAARVNEEDKGADGGDATQDEENEEDLLGEPGGDEHPETSFSFSDEALSGKQKFTRKTGAWAETAHVLDRGVHGPSLDTIAALADFTHKLPLEQGKISFYVREKFAHEDPASLLKTNRVLFAGHCVEMISGEFAQIILPRVLCEDDEDEFGVKDMALVSGFDYVDISINSGKHPVLPIPFLKRGRTYFAPLREIRRRVHVIPIFRPRAEDNYAAVKFAERFVVNPLVFKQRRGPAHPPVCLTCPNGCPGVRLKIPPKGRGEKVTCTACSHIFRWL